jgi:hypothetical protein
MTGQVEIDFLSHYYLVGESSADRRHFSLLDKAHFNA